MRYHEAADYLFRLRRFGSRPGTESTADLLAHLGDPHEGVAFVQIAGSNGKGSTARMTERILRETGLSVGLFISPHLDDLRERIRVDGRKIPRGDLCEFVEAIREYATERGADGESPTFFEATTAMALWHFAREDVDVAVLEVGIGGKLDATSVVDPTAAAVTNVSLEHTNVLGDTVEEIARDKAHVVPVGNPLVTATTGEALATVTEMADGVVTVGGPDSDPDVTATYEGRHNHTESAVSLSGPDWEVDARIPLLGTYQAENAGVAAALSRQVAEDFGAGVSADELARGLRGAHWPGRFEVMGREPLVVLDGAHNAAACEQAAETLAEFEYDSLHLVFGAMHDKSHREMADALSTADSVRTCRPTLPRAEDPEVLARVFERVGVEEVLVRDAVADAVAETLDTAGPDDCVLVCGSLFTVAEARTRWTRRRIPKRVEDLVDARKVLAGADVSEEVIREAHGDAVHRVVKTRLQRRQASHLREELVGLDGTCAISGLESDGEDRDVVLMGTLAQFEALTERLDDAPCGLAEVGAELRELLGIDVPESKPASPWEEGTAVMGVLNVTPDSFHDGGEYERHEDAVSRARQLVEAGAEIVDVGGESTRPGADPISIEEEIDRVVPVIERISAFDATISVDTRKAAVARAALEAGADVINDVSGLEDPEMRFVAAEHNASLIIMHSIDAPVVPETDPRYDDVVEDVIDELGEKVLLAEKAGLDRERIVVDPGLGFGKRAAESFELLGRLDELRALGCPILIGHSHKSMLELVGGTAGDALYETVAATALAAYLGADIVRVHDVAENATAVRTAGAVSDPSTFDGK